MKYFATTIGNSQHLLLSLWESFSNKSFPLRNYESDSTFFERLMISSYNIWQCRVDTSKFTYIIWIFFLKSMTALFHNISKIYYFWFKMILYFVTHFLIDFPPQILDHHLESGNGRVSNDFSSLRDASPYLPPFCFRRE